MSLIFSGEIETDAIETGIFEVFCDCGEKVVKPKDGTQIILSGNIFIVNYWCPKWEKRASKKEAIEMLDRWYRGKSKIGDVLHTADLSPLVSNRHSVG